MNILKSMKANLNAVRNWKKNLSTDEIDSQYFLLYKKNISLYFFLSIFLIAYYAILLLCLAFSKTFNIHSIEVRSSLIMISVFASFVILRLFLRKLLEKSHILARIFSISFWCLAVSFISYDTVIMIYEINDNTLLSYIIFLFLFIIFARVRLVDSLVFVACAILSQVIICTYALIQHSAMIPIVIWLQIFLFPIVAFLGQQFIYWNILKLSVATLVSEQISHVDYLTGLYNRRGYYKQLQKLLKNAQTITVIIVDIDNFKNYNDKYGHREGDQALAKICTCIQNHFSNSLVCRWGGEEILIATPDITKEYICQELKALMIKIENLRIPAAVINNSRYITISAGIAMGTKEEGYDDEDLIRRADKVLYDAKESGRNCMRFYECQENKKGE